MSFTPGPLQKIAPNVKIGENAFINDFVNLYGCTIGAETKIGPFVEIQKSALVGERCKISSHACICEGVTTEGAGAVVGKDLTDGVVVAGNPSYVLRFVDDKDGD